jgi:short-subunit dehydrogenase
MELSGAVVVVTGASAGIGRATALAFARQGSILVLAARRERLLEDVAAEIRAHGRQALVVPCDVSRWDEVDALRSRTADAFGRCDVLVNNAGIPGGGPFVELSVEQIQRIAGVNYLGVLYATKAFLPMMLAERRGHVVNIASLAGRFAVPGASVYTSTKHAVVAFSESLDLTTKTERVRVTAVNPAFVQTEAFSARGRPRLLTLTPERVANVIVKVVREEIAPEYTIPRWAAAFQVLRVVTPPLYRWAMSQGARRLRAPTPATRPRSDWPRTQ